MKGVVRRMVALCWCCVPMVSTRQPVSCAVQSRHNLHPDLHHHSKARTKTSSSFCAAESSSSPADRVHTSPHKAHSEHQIVLQVSSFSPSSTTHSQHPPRQVSAQAYQHYSSPSKGTAPSSFLHQQQQGLHPANSPLPHQPAICDHGNNRRHLELLHPRPRKPPQARYCGPWAKR